MDEQNTTVSEPVTQPAGEANTPVIMESAIAPEPRAPAVEQTAQTESPPPTPETPMGPHGALPFSKTDDLQENLVAQLPPSEPLPNLTPVEATQSPTVSPQAPAQPEPASQSVPMPAPAPVIVVQNRIKDFFAKAAQVIQFRKQKKLTKIMTLFTKKTHITNDEVEKLLHVSDATATRYLSQLEKQGKIK